MTLENAVSLLSSAAIAQDDKKNTRPGIAPDDTTSGQSLDWRINGALFFAKIARKIKGNWYGGLLARIQRPVQSHVVGNTSQTDLGGTVKTACS